MKNVGGVSRDDPSLIPDDPRLQIKNGTEAREHCKNVTHYEITHDITEVVQIEATFDTRNSMKSMKDPVR